MYHFLKPHIYYIWTLIYTLIFNKYINKLLGKTYMQTHLMKEVKIISLCKKVASIIFNERSGKKKLCNISRAV